MEYKNSLSCPLPKFREEIYAVEAEYKNSLSWALTEAICKDDANAVQKIIDKGVCLNPQPKLDDGIAAVKEAAFNLPLVKAVRANASNEVLQVLMAAGAQIDVPNVYGMSTLYFAALDNKPALAQKLIDLNYPVDILNFKGETPLHAAVYYLNSACVQALVNAGASVYAQNDYGVSPMELFNAIYRRKGLFASQEEKKAFTLIRKTLMQAAIKHHALLREGSSDIDSILHFERKQLLYQSNPSIENGMQIKPLLIAQNNFSKSWGQIVAQHLQEKQAVNI